MGDTLREAIITGPALSPWLLGTGGNFDRKCVAVIIIHGGRLGDHLAVFQRLEITLSQDQVMRVTIHAIGAAGGDGLAAAGRIFHVPVFDSHSVQVAAIGGRPYSKTTRRCTSGVIRPLTRDLGDQQR